MLIGAHRIDEDVDVTNICWDARSIEPLSVSPSELTFTTQRMSRFAKRYPHGRTTIVAVCLVDQMIAKLLVLRGYTSTRDRTVHG